MNYFIQQKMRQVWIQGFFIGFITSALLIFIISLFFILS